MRESRERILLDILGLMRKSGPINPRSIAIKGLGLSYACVYDNVKFLEEKGFVRLLKRGRAGAKLYDITIRGLLASLFSPTYPPLDEELEGLRRRDWGSHYIEPLQRVGSLSQLKEVVEMIYTVGSSLEEVNEDILRRFIRDPHDIRTILDLLRHAKVIPISFQAQEAGRYIFAIPSIPGSFAFCRNEKVLEGEEYVNLLINPTRETSKKLANLIERDPKNEDYIGSLMIALFESLVAHLSNGEDIICGYCSETHQFIVLGTMPEEVTKKLQHAEQILAYIKKTYQDMISRLKEGNI